MIILTLLVVTVGRLGVLILMDGGRGRRRSLVAFSRRSLGVCGCGRLGAPAGGEDQCRDQQRGKGLETSNCSHGFS